MPLMCFLTQRVKQLTVRPCGMMISQSLSNTVLLPMVPAEVTPDTHATGTGGHVAISMASADHRAGIVGKGGESWSSISPGENRAVPDQ